MVMVFDCLVFITLYLFAFVRAYVHVHVFVKSKWLWFFISFLNDCSDTMRHQQV